MALDLTQGNTKGASNTINRTNSLYDDEEEVHDYYSSDEDDPKWTLDAPLKALVSVVTFGWLEGTMHTAMLLLFSFWGFDKTLRCTCTSDGRCGYSADSAQKYQWCPKPISSLRTTADPADPHKEQFICKMASAGSRHTALLMIDSSHRKGWKPPRPKDQPRNPWTHDYDEEVVDIPPRKLKIMLCGLNQVGLCEEKGQEEPVDVPFDCSGERRPAYVEAGKGTTYIITKRGRVFSFGHGRYGVLGHGDCYSNQVPTLIRSLSRKSVVKVAVGGHHVFAMTEDEQLYGWGRNDKGQLGRGFESDYELKIEAVQFDKIAKYRLIDIACGEEHTIAVIGIRGKEGNMENMIFGWGDHSRGQLGSGDVVHRMRPQNNRWIQKFMKHNQVRVHKLIAGAYHNFVVVKMSGQVIAWGGNDYGQLGNGFQWDDPQPRFMNNMKGVVSISAGQRHNLAICEHESTDVYGWGYNAYGELGLGDTMIRLQPTKLTAIKDSRVISVSCGDRHSVIVTSHKPIKAKESTTLKPYFRILEVRHSTRSTAFIIFVGFTVSLSSHHLIISLHIRTMGIIKSS